MSDPGPGSPAEPARRARPVLLIADDDPENRRALRRMLGSEFDIHEAGDGTEALERARQLRPDVVITDQRMPTMTGTELLSELKTELPQTARILFTGHHNYESLVDAVNAAQVHHYFEKPFHTVDVKTVVQALVRTRELQAEREQLAARLAEANAALSRKKDELEHLVAERTEALRATNESLAAANARLRELSMRDELTGLFNRRALFEQLELEVQRSARYGREFSLLFLDVDDFKRINDAHGHAAGDAALRTIATLLHSTDGVRRSDFVARYGGEEFCVVLPETPLAGAEVKAERIRSAAETLPPLVTGAGAPLSLTVSVGVASFPHHGDDVDSLLKAADGAQYVAKQSGKNRVVVAGS
jgi:diguanylate cyclase (GGDEF)-like protein